jgi:hypothetical protein
MRQRLILLVVPDVSCCAAIPGAMVAVAAAAP